MKKIYSEECYAGRLINANVFVHEQYSIQLKYTIEGVSKIPVPLEQAYFPRLRLGK